MFQSLLTTLLLTCSLSSVQAARSLRLGGVVRQRDLFRLANGTVDFSWVNKEATLVKAKYANAPLPSKRAKTRSRRASGTVPLLDNIDYSLGVPFDLTYYGNMSIGTPAQTLPIDFDTDDSDIWVPVDCVGGCASGYFDTNASSTYVDTGAAWGIQYGLGLVYGTVASDTVSLSGLTVPKQAIGAATQISSNFLSVPYVGIFGLGFSTISTLGAPTLIENLISAGKLDSNLFTFYLERGQFTGSELTIGAIDPTKYTGEIEYHQVVSKGYWELYWSTAVVDGYPAAIPAFGAAMDTGTTLIYVPTGVAADIYKAIPGASFDSFDSGNGVAYYQFPCDATLPTISFSFRGSNTQYKILNSDINIGTTTLDPTQCVGGIIGEDITGPDGRSVAIFGDAFLKSHYSVYNYDQNNGIGAVGLATAV